MDIQYYTAGILWPTVNNTISHTENFVKKVCLMPNVSNEMQDIKADPHIQLLNWCLMKYMWSRQGSHFPAVTALSWVLSPLLRIFRSSEPTTYTIP